MDARLSPATADPVDEKTGAALPENGPVIVLGYIKEFLNHLQLDDAGRLDEHRPLAARIDQRHSIGLA